MKIDEYIYWVKNIRGTEYERVGKIIAVIMPSQHPNTTQYGKVVSDNYPARNHETYLVLCRGTIFYVDNGTPVPEDKWGVYDTQAKPTVKRGSTIIDKSDRLKLKKWMKKLGVEFSESDKALHVPAWYKRFWFKVDDGVEFVSSIENIKLV